MNKFYSLDEKISYIAKNEFRYFFNKLNVIGVGLGYKIKNGFCTYEKCITVFVTKKLSSNEVPLQKLVPCFYKGIPTDIIQTDIPKVCSLTTRIRPATGGYSIGAKNFSSGSIGCLVGDSSNDYILTCNHVVAGNQKKRGEIIFALQPAPEHGGTKTKDIIGQLYDYAKVLPGSTWNTMDAAIVLTDRENASTEITFIGYPTGINKTKVGESVQKVGAISGLTLGNVTSTNTTITIDFLGESVMFQDQIITTKMSVLGDSGSVLLNKKKEVIGLLMANSGSNTIYNKIGNIVNRFNVNVLKY